MRTEGGLVQLEGFKELTVCNILSGFYSINESGEIISQKAGKKLLPKTDKKLDEWHDLCHWIETLPYSQLITGN